MLSLHVWAIDPAGHEIQMKDDAVLDVGDPGSGEMYTDERARVAHPPGADPGGVVAYEYERRERPYLAETTWWFQGSVPHLHESFTLVLPQGFKQNTSWAHHAADNGADLENGSYRWEMSAVPAIDLDHVPMAPAEESLAGRMTVHYSGPTLAEPQEGTWQGVGEWYAHLSSGRMQASPELSAKAAELVAGKTDFYDRAEAIGEFVQSKVRYYAVELGVGGYQPHPAAETFRLRYGDCKDKATLMASMLESAGIHGALMIVDTERGVIDPGVPSIVGNHAIGAIEVPVGYNSAKLRSVVMAKTGKRYLIFDPTWERTPFGQLERNLQGSYGVLMEGKDSQVVELPVMAPSLNHLSRTGHFALGKDGSLKGQVLESRIGDVSDYPRRIFSQGDSREQTEYMARRVDADVANASITGLKVEHIDSLHEPLTTSYQLESSRFATAAGQLLLVRPRVLGSFAMEFDSKHRVVPVDLRETLSAEDNYEITVPAEYKLDELPAPVKVDVGFAVYQSTTEMEGSTLRYKRSYTVRAVTVPAAKYDEVRALAAAIAADEGSEVVLRKQ